MARAARPTEANPQLLELRLAGRTVQVQSPAYLAQLGGEVIYTV